MIPDVIRLSTLLRRIINKCGPEWYSLDPMSIMVELGFPDYLVLEKIYVLIHAANHGINEALKDPVYLILFTTVANNNYAEFETLDIPNCLELAWGLYEARLISKIMGEKFNPTEELIDTVSYILTEDGFSKAPPPFEFVPEAKLHPGQTEADIKLKEKGIISYLQHMSVEQIIEDSTPPNKAVEEKTDSIFVS